MTGEAGIDARGLWINDKDTGTQLRIGSVGYELAATMAEHGNRRLMRETLKKNRLGLWFSKTF